MSSPSASCIVSAAFCLVACSGQAPNEPNSDGQEEPSASVLPKTTAFASPCHSATAPQSAEVWRRSLAEDANVLFIASVATDASGNAFVARATGETFKVSSRGSVLWSKPFGSLVATDARGSAILAGTFSGTLDLGERSLTATGGTDVYVVELDHAGDLIYALALGGTEDESALALAVDAQGNAIVSGPGLGTWKLNPSGKPAWKRDFHGAVSIDSSGNVVMTGAVTESDGGKDIFVAKLDGAGNHLFSRRFGDAGALQYGEAIAVDRNDDILVSGVFDGSVDFGAGAVSVSEGSCSAESWCKQAGFVVKLDPSGDHLWSQTRAPVRSLPGLVSDSRGHVLVSGAYPGNAPPYRTVLLLELDQYGNELSLSGRLDSSLTDAGAGHRIAVDRCDNVLWSLDISPEPGANASATSLLVKLAPNCPGV